MKTAAFTGAMMLMVVAAFALFQSAAVGQPLHDWLGQLGVRARAVARGLALAVVGLACAVLARALGWTEAALLTAVTLVMVASSFVLFAAVAPRLVWAFALAAPLLAGVLAVGAEALP